MNPPNSKSNSTRPKSDYVHHHIACCHSLFSPAVVGASDFVDIKCSNDHLEIKMRTSLDVASDVLDAAKTLAAARGISVGAALSELAMRGVEARTPLTLRNGFPVFQLPALTSGFGPDEIAAAVSKEVLESAREFMNPGQ